MDVGYFIDILVIILLVFSGFAMLGSFGLFLYFYIRMLLTGNDSLQADFRNRVRWSAILFGITAGGVLGMTVISNILISNLKEQQNKVEKRKKNMLEVFNNKQDVIDKLKELAKRISGLSKRHDPAKYKVDFNYLFNEANKGIEKSKQVSFNDFINNNNDKLTNVDYSKVQYRDYDTLLANVDSVANL